ncbi:MAG TPA: hypothetical protein VF038_12765 [Usitatibacter sp.]
MRFHRLVAVPVAMATWPALAAGGVASGAGALQASASIDLRIDVPKVLEMRLLDHPSTIEVTAADAVSGEIVVTGPRIEMVSNDRRGYWVDASLRGPFEAATVEGLPAPMEVDGSGGRALMPSMVGQSRPRPYTVRYRLRLREGTAPGSYAWPVALSIDSP